MGAENLGPLLYAWVRFAKPANVLEIGAGYTSMFLLRALEDNAAEIEAYRALRAEGACRCGDAPWSVDAFFTNKNGPDENVIRGTLHCVDNMAHAHTTANAVAAAAKRLGLSDRLRLHEADAHDPDLPSLLAPKVEFDMLWIDLGAAHKTERFVRDWWPRVRSDGGIVVVHSSLTNAMSRGWVERARDHCHSQRVRAADGSVERRSAGPEREGGASEFDELGEFETLSLLEPHKMFQNAVTVLQKRGGRFGRYDEPVLTKFP